MNNQQYAGDEIDLRDYIKVIIKRKKVVLFIFSIGVIITTIVTFLMPKTYEASTIISIGNVAGALISKPEAIQVLKSKKMLSSALRKFNLNVAGPEKINLEDITGTNLLRLKIEYDDPDLAVKICEAIANSFISKGKDIYDRNFSLLNEKMGDLKQRERIIKKEIKRLNQKISTHQMEDFDSLHLQDTLLSYENTYAGLNDKIYLLKNKLINSKEFELFESPSKPKSPIKPNKKLNIAVSAVSGLMLGIFGAFFQEYWEKGKVKKSRQKS